MKKIFAVILALVSLAACAEAQISGKRGTGRGVGKTISTDVTAPNISSIVATPGANAFTVTWNTNELADTRLFRGPSGGPYTTECQTISTFETSHSATCAGLNPSTQYFYVVKSADNAGNIRTCNVDGTGGGACPSATELTVTTDAAAGGDPPYGTTSTAVIIPRSYSEAQPYPAPVSVTTGSQCGTPVNTCTINTSPDHNLETGDFIHITGTGTNADVDDSPVSACSRVSPSASVSCDTSALVTFPSGARVYIEGGNLALIAGAWTVASVPTSTSFTFTSLETATVSLTTGTVNYAVQITKVDNDTFTYTKTGASGSFSSGTVSSTRALPPVAGGTFTESGLLNAPIKLFVYSSSASGQDEKTLYNYHSLVQPIDAGGQFIQLTRSSGWNIFNLSDGSVACSPTDSGGAVLRWDRVIANKMWRINGNRIQYRTSYAPSNCNAAYTDENDFNVSHGCTFLSFAGNEGSGTTLGNRIAIVCQTGSAPNRYKFIVWRTDTHSAEAVITGPSQGFGDVDYMHIVEGPAPTYSLLGVGFRSLAVATALNACSASRSGNTVTFTCPSGTFDHVAVGEKFRSFTCSQSEYNRTWTIDSFTTSTVVATQAGLTATSASSCEIGTQWRGMPFWKWNGSALVFENNVRHGGAHGAWTIDQQGEAVWVGHVDNDSNCNSNLKGALSHKAMASYWPDGTANNYSSAKQCLFGFNGVSSQGDENISAAGGWISTSPNSHNTTGQVNKNESAIQSGWPALWTPYEGEIVLCKLVPVGDPNSCFRLAHMRTGLDHHLNGVYPAVSFDRRYIVWNCSWRYVTGSNMGAVCIIDLGAW